MPWPVHPTGFFGARGDSDTYRIERSLRFNSADSAYLSRTPSSAGNRKTWTWSGWVKRSKIGAQDFIIFNEGGLSSNYVVARFASGGSGDNIEFFGSAGAFNKTTSNLFRDPSAWYHFVFVMDATNLQAKIYVNGVEATYSTNTNPSNADQNFNRAQEVNIGRATSNTQHFDGYLTEINFIDGQALTPSSFGETDAITGRWKAKAYSGTYGTNGFYLNFSDNSSLTTTSNVGIGKDFSGNTNYWATNGISINAGAGNDSLVDSPTNYGSDSYSTSVDNARGNYCTIDALSKDQRKIAQATFSASLTNGNLDWTNTATGVSGGCPATISASIKCYFEARLNTVGNEATIGISKIDANWRTIGGASDSSLYCWDVQGGYYYNAGASITGKPTATTGDILMVAYDPSNGKIWFGKNGTWNGSGAPSGGTNEAFVVSDYANPKIPFVLGYSSASLSLNFGQRPFAYTAPTGFKALCTQNLTQPTIQKPSTAMDVVTYTGTGASNSISSLGFSPDLVWIKNRGTTTNHAIYDTVRGAQAQISSNSTSAEVTSSTGLTSFDANGFTIGTSTLVNTSGTQYVAWAWDESAISGFDIVKQTLSSTGINTINHSLGVTPKMIIAKRTDGSEAWLVYHQSATSQSQYLSLNSTSAVTTSANLWGSSSITSTQFYFNGTINISYVFYLFAEIEGYSKFGSYTGNGSSDGPFVWCGFRPRWVMIKRSDASSTYSHWYIIDSSRNPYNIAFGGSNGNNFLKVNGSDPENYYNYSTNDGGSFPIDFLSNGFKYRLNNSGGDVNASGGTYIFAAFAEAPFKYARAR